MDKKTALGQENLGAPTLSDVALRAGASKGAASVVLNGAKSTIRVSEEVRERLRKAADELGYHPNAVARGLARGRMHTLGVLFSAIETAVVTNYYATAILQGIMTAAASADYNITLFTKSSTNSGESAAFLRDRSTDGVLVIAPIISSPVIAKLSGRGLPVIVISSRFEEYGVPAVDVDNEMGTRLAVEHLLALGHRRIAHLMGDIGQYHAITRRDTFRATLAGAGIAVPPEYLAPTNYDPEISYAATRKLLTLPEPPTAIFAGNDSIAIPVMEAARDMGLSVPGGLSVIGFDDVAAAALVAPPLTTIHQPLVRIGEMATELLVALLAGEPVAEETHLIKPELVVRGSTAPPHA